jgi:hypothetical protein
MKRKKPKRTPEEIARSEEVQHDLLERIAFHEQRLEDELARNEGRAPRKLPPPQPPTSEEVRRLLLERIDYHESRLDEERRAG